MFHLLLVGHLVKTRIRSQLSADKLRSLAAPVAGKLSSFGAHGVATLLIT